MITPTPTPTLAIPTATADRPDAAALHRLLAWLSPAYPTGAFSYSHGLEAAVEAGAVRDRAGLEAYAAAVLRSGAGAVDGALLAAAWDAAAAGAADDLDALAALAAAWRGSAETALETMAQGEAFARATLAAWPEPRLAAFLARHPRGPAAPVAFGAAAACHAVPRRAALSGWLGAFAAALVSAGVRLVPLGQTDGQVATARLLPHVEAAADAALAAVAGRRGAAALDAVGTASPALDLFSMAHETQYTRLFRS